MPSSKNRLRYIHDCASVMSPWTRPVFCPRNFAGGLSDTVIEIAVHAIRPPRGMFGKKDQAT
jgi:hypothetical protein